MKSLRMQFFLFFIGLGMLISLGVGITMYIQYNSYIRYTYSATLNRSLELVKKQFPVMEDTDYILREGKAGSPAYWEMINSMENIVESFGLAYIYFVHKHNGGYQFLLSSEFAPKDPPFPITCQ